MKTMDPELVFNLLEDQEDVLGPIEKQREENLLRSRCPACGSKSTTYQNADIDDLLTGGGAAVCLSCGWLFRI